LFCPEIYDSRQHQELVSLLTDKKSFPILKLWGSSVAQGDRALSNQRAPLVLDFSYLKTRNKMIFLSMAIKIEVVLVFEFLND
jgi:hypothetical protein